MYLVYYSSGSYDTAYEHNVFVTENEEVAIAYITKFNRILQNLKKYYHQNIEELMWDENEKYDWMRWMRIMETHRATYQTIEKR
jgi:hypothetical protein